MMRESSPSPSPSSTKLSSSSSAPSSSSSSPSTNLWKTFKQFDIYQKIDENFRIQTTAGAISKFLTFSLFSLYLNFTSLNFLVSLAGWVVIAILVLAEVRNYATPKYNELLVVDSTFGEQMEVNINITFHSLTCNEVSCHNPIVSTVLSPANSGSRRIWM